MTPINVKLIELQLIPFFKITLQSLKSWRWSTAMKKKNYMGPWVVVVVIIIIIIMFIIIIIIIIIIIQDVLV